MTPIRLRSKLCAAGVGTPLLLVVAVALLEPPLHPDPVHRSAGEAVGVFHVHTVASDGGGTVDDVMGAARAGGLDFVVLTDHNLWGAPEWSYRDSVLLIVGEEVNTSYGHLVVAGGGPIGDRRRPEGEPNAVAPPGDGRRPAHAVAPREGLRIAAHPTGRTPWTGWEGDEFDGIEIWNADTERRNDGSWEWLRAVALLPTRAMAALYRLLDHPTDELALWDRLLEERPVFGVCAVDAHHTLPLNRSRSLDLHFPGYRHSFAMARQHVLLEAPRSGRPEEDGRAILEAVARGRSYCAFDGLADAGGARFRVDAGDASGTLGDSVVWSPGTRLRVTLPEGTRSRIDTEVRVLRNGREVGRWPDVETLEAELPGPGIFRVEVLLRRRGTLLPWILTNPVWVIHPASDQLPAAGS